jgi:RHS repeat-associated protein
VGTFLESSGSSALDAALYGYNEGNQRTAYTNAAGAYDLYTYDPIGQLKVGTSSTVSEDRGYGYDAAWNLNYLTNNGSTTTYSVDGQNQLTSVAGTPCLYDANGNLVRVGSPASGMYLTYTYDDENRLTEVATNYAAIQEPEGGVPALLVSNPWNSDLVYDGLGRLRKRLEYVNGILQTTTLYLYDGWRVIQERDVNDNPTVSYTRGADLSGSLEGAGGIGGLLARSSGYSSGNWTSHAYYHADGNGNITCLINASQSVVASYRYDPYGNTLSQSGTLAVANVYRFSSKEIHTNSLMYYYGYRFYDPGLQRWINRDPLGEPGFELIRRHPPLGQPGEPNSYLFVANDPLNRVDYLGLKDWWKVVEAGWWAFEHALPGDEFVDALKAFGGCGSLSAAMTWAENSFEADIQDAVMKADHAAQKAAEKKWGDKINRMRKVYANQCTPKCKK